MAFFTILSFGIISSCSSDSDPPEIPPQQNRAPNAFSLQSVSNSTATSLNPTLNWDAATDPDGDNVKYTVYLDTLESPEKIVASNISETSFTVTDTLIDNTPYYWKVMASDGNGGTTFSSSILNLKTISINIQLSSESTTVKPYQLVVLTSDNHTFNEESYTADFGDTVVNLVKTEDGDIAFIVPDVASNTYELSLTSQNKVGILSFTVEANEVQNVENKINEEFLEPMATHNQDITEYLDDENLSSESRTMLQDAKDLYDIYMRRYATATNEEKLVLAKFLNANPIFTTIIETSSDRGINNNANSMLYGGYNSNSILMNRNHHDPCMSFTTYHRIIVGAWYVYGILLYKMSAASAISGGTLAPIAFAAAVVGGIVITKKIVHTFEIMFDCHVHKIRNSLEEVSNILPYNNSNNGGNILGNSNFLALRESTTSSFTMTNNQFSSFNVKTSVRKLDASDVNNENSMVSDIIEKYNTFVDKWNTFKTTFNNIITATSNWFTSLFSDDAQNIKPITATVEPLPASSPVTVIDGDNSHITLENIPTDITAEVQREGESGLRIKFSTDNETLPRTFTATLKYDDGTFETNDEISVTLEQEEEEEEFDIKGCWDIEITEVISVDPPDRTLDFDMNNIIFADGDTCLLEVGSCLLNYDASNLRANTYTFVNNSLFYNYRWQNSSSVATITITSNSVNTDTGVINATVNASKIYSVNPSRNTSFTLKIKLTKISDTYE